MNLKKAVKITLFFLVFFPNLSLLSQDVELPDFVVEGLHKVSLPKIKKSPIKFFKALDEDYFKRKFSPDDFDVAIKLAPDTAFAIPFIRGISYSGKIKTSFGYYSLPNVDFFTDYSNDNFYLSVSANGKYVRNFMPNSALYKGGGKFILQYFWDNSEKSRSFSFFALNGGGNYFDRNFWASETPLLKRKALFSNGEAEFYHFSPGKYKFGFLLSEYYLNLMKENIEEQKLNVKFSGEIDFDKFNLKTELNAILLESVIKTDKTKKFYNGNILTEIKFTENISAEFGGIFTFWGNEKFFFPILDARFNINKFFLIKTDIKAKADFYSTYDLVLKNPFIKINSFAGIQSKDFEKFSVSLFFNYYNYINGMVKAKYGVKDGFIYYDDSGNKGIFNLKTLDNISSLSLNFNFDLFYSKFGYLSLKSRFADNRMANGNVAPYSPSIFLETAYYYNYKNKFTLGIGTHYFSHFYSDLANSKRIEPSWNLWSSAKMRLSESFNISLDFDNILNKNNYFLPGYNSTPFDILLGVEYSWK